MVWHHHISTFSRDLKENNWFYTEVLGLRRVKVTVNQNLPEMYHIFYGDQEGSAGNDFTFFDYSTYAPRKKGTNAITGFGFYVPSEESLPYWQERLAQFQVDSELEDFLGTKRLRFEDPDGVSLWMESGQDKAVPQNWQPWTENDILGDHLIQGMSTAEVTVRDGRAFAEMMEKFFDYKTIELDDQYLLITPQNPAENGDIIIKEEAGRIEAAGQGTIHHIALQIEASELNSIKEEIEAAGYRTMHYDRYYFDSLYFRGENSIMLEIVANSDIGLNPQGEESSYGEKLDLPPKFQDRREELEKVLRPLEEWTK